MYAKRAKRCVHKSEEKIKNILSVGHLHQHVRVFVSVFVVPPRRREAFYPPPSAAECLKYLTGTALFLGLCSVC